MTGVPQLSVRVGCCRALGPHELAQDQSRQCVRSWLVKKAETMPINLERKYRDANKGLFLSNESDCFYCFFFLRELGRLFDGSLKTKKQ